jgi:hypothetical protein
MLEKWKGGQKTLKCPSVYGAKFSLPIIPSSQYSSIASGAKTLNSTEHDSAGRHKHNGNLIGAFFLARRCF